MNTNNNIKFKKKNVTKNETFFAILFIITGYLAFLPKWNGLYFYEYFPTSQQFSIFQVVVSSGVWIFVMLLFFYKLFLKNVNKLFVVFLPLIFLFFVTFVLSFFNMITGGDNSFLSSSILQIMKIGSAFLFAIMIATVFRKKSIFLSLIVIFLIFLTNIISTILQFGMDDFIKYLLSSFIFLNNNTNISSIIHVNTYIEVGDTTFAAAMFLLYYVFFFKTGFKKERFWGVILSILIIFIGIKRIELVGIVVAFAISILFLKIKVKRNSFLFLFSFCSMVAMSFMFISFTKSGKLFEITKIFDLSVSGRDNLYGRIPDIYTLNPLYFGKGYYFLKYFQRNNFGTALHSDILGLYIELGFLPYIFLLIIYFFIIPNYFVKMKKYNEAKILVISLIYLFVTYLTDNTFSFYCVQFTFILIPIALSISGDNHHEIIRSTI
jgi:hypothetical protein